MRRLQDENGFSRKMHIGMGGSSNNQMLKWVMFCDYSFGVFVTKKCKTVNGEETSYKVM